MTPRYLCHFSCGAASAVATKLTLEERAHVLIVNAFIAEEHRDNRRFLTDCERWFGKPIRVLRDERFGASTHEVWKKKRFIKGHMGAPCSKALKRDLIASVAMPDDIHIIGYTVEEESRFADLCTNFPNERFAAPLIDHGISHQDCLAIVDRAGIKIPKMYRMGYRNANCIGCPKGGQNYWQKIRKDFPEQFVQIQTIQEDIGEGAKFLRFRSGPRKNQRMWLRELPAGDGNLSDDADFHCGMVCEGVSAQLEAQA